MGMELWEMVGGCVEGKGEGVKGRCVERICDRVLEGRGCGGRCGTACGHTAVPLRFATALQPAALSRRALYHPRLAPPHGHTETCPHLQVVPRPHTDM
eukprot:366559-Chlamydomonas_euryale.AAC.18